MKTLLLLAVSLSAFSQSVINPASVSVDAPSEAAVIKWLGTQYGANGSELTSPVDANAVKIQVKNAVNLSTAVAIVIESEQMDVKAVNGLEITVTRGFNGTAKALHGKGSAINVMKHRTISDFARTIIIESFRKIVEDQDLETAAANNVIAAKNKSNNGVR